MNHGIISGAESILDAGGSNNTLTNFATLNGAVIFGVGNDTVTNSGTINGVGLGFGGGTNKLTNSGAIAGDVVGGSGNDTVENSKSIGGEVNLGDGTNTFFNSGTIGGDVIGGSSNDAAINSGTIGGTVNFHGGNNSVINTGTITDDVGDFAGGGSGNDTVNNAGTIGDDVFLGDGTNAFLNTGTIGGRVNGGSGNDTVNNTRTMGDDVRLGDGTNTLTNSGTIALNVRGGSGIDTVTDTGIIAGIVDLLGGNDKFTGGKSVETVKDGDGADTVKLGGNDDRYIATGNTGTDGHDTIDGGTGLNDTYDASAAIDAVFINLDTISHDFSPFLPGLFIVPANTAVGADVADAAHVLNDTITNFENAKGGAGVDAIYGSAAANTLDSGGGGGIMFGFGGNDTLIGGAGDEGLVGGAGKDTLTSGTGADVFFYSAITDSGVTTATRDLITDFEDGIDKIDLANIDANTTNGVADDAFNFIGTNVAFSHVAGELRAFWTASGKIIEGDVNGDAKADFSIELTDPTHVITLTGADFFL